MVAALRRAGANVLVNNRLTEYAPLESTGGIGNLVDQFNGAGALTWRIGDRYLTFGALVGGLVELAVVLAAATFVYRLGHRDANLPATSDDVGDDGGEDLAGSGV
jgi:hypothetical protein